MATATPIRLYSFRPYNSVLTQLQGIAPADVSLVSSIEAALLEASQNYAARDYQAAIGAYLKAQALLYSQLDSSSVLGELQRVPDLPRDPSLFDPLLSASLEWMNVLPVAGPVSPVRPQVPVDAGALSKVSSLEGVGLTSAAIGTKTGMEAAADLHLAETLTALGNPEAAKFYANRANQVDASVAAILQRSNGAPAPPPVAATPAAAASPAPVAQPAAPAGQAAGVVRAGLTPAGAAAKLATEAVPVASAQPAIERLRGGLEAAAFSDLRAAAPTVAEPITIRPVVDLPSPATVNRSVGVLAAGKVNTIAWKAGTAPPLAQVKGAAYAVRTSAVGLVDGISQPAVASDLILAMPHNYFYVIPLGLAECYHALGDWASAEKFYLQAAAYAYLNQSVEVPYLWSQLATLYLDWGNALYMSGNAPGALPVYEKVLNADSTAPAAGVLFTMSSLAPAATTARAVITNLSALVANPASAATLGLDPQICAVILQVHQKLVQIAAGLDYWGHWAPRVPIWTFAYLQQVAINFAQLAISAEQQVISFWDRADQGRLTRTELTQQVAQANAEVSAAQAQTQAAQAEQAVYQRGLTLATQRATDAQQDASEYQATSSAAIVHQALQSQLAGGDDGDAATLNAYADIMMSGNYSLSDSGATLAAAEQLTAARLSQQYQVDSLQRTATQLKDAEAQAEAEVNAANAQVTAAQAAQAVAGLKAQQASAMVGAFDAQTFTPDVWQAMGDELLRLYHRYFSMALKVAELMQQAYNFETDQQLDLIKTSYATDEVKGLLGADALMADIQGFSYDLITSTKSKAQPLKHTLSLAQHYGWDFETQLRKTGSMTFETRIDDFDYAYPGTYAGRIKAVQVNVIGLVPVTGISGTLTCGGLSWYRLPSSLWPADQASGLKARVQSSETLVLSDYSPTADSLLYAPDGRIGPIFDGAGVASSWTLNLPKEVNDIDYGALLDVTVTFLYEARFDPDLAARVQSQLDSRPGTSSRQRGIPLRWLYPDLFFGFVQTGDLNLTLAPSDFPTNQTKPQLTSIGLQVSTSAPVSASGINFALGTPGHPAAVKAATDATGTISSLSTGSAWAALATGPATGPYGLSLDKADNPALVKSGSLDLSAIENVALVITYTFTPKS